MQSLARSERCAGEFGLFRGCPDLLADALEKFDEHFQNMVAEILRVPCLSEDQWEQGSLPHKLVAALLGQDSYEPTGVSELLSVHETLTGTSHDFVALSDATSVQQLLSTERHSAMYTQLRAKVSVRSQNLMLACAMPHASDWLLTPPIPGLGLALGSDCFRTALKFRLGMLCLASRFRASGTAEGVVRECQMDVYGDHAMCCHNGPSLYFRHNSIRDILGHAARAAGLSAVVIEKRNQVEGSNAKPGDITVQHYHRAFAKYFRCGYPVKYIRRTLYSQVSVSLQRSLAQAVIDRRSELNCEHVL